MATDLNAALTHLDDDELLLLGASSGDLTEEARPRVADALAARELAPELVQALRHQPSEDPAGLDALVTRTRGRRCPNCGDEGGEINAIEEDVGEGELGMLAAGLLMGVAVAPVANREHVLVGCPRCLGWTDDRGAPARGVAPSPAFESFVQAQRHLLESFDGRPDLVDAVLGQAPQTLVDRLRAPFDEDWRAVGVVTGHTRPMVQLFVTSDPDALERRKRACAANGIDTVVLRAGVEGRERYALYVPRHEVERTRAGLEHLDDDPDAPTDFCFHCGASTSPGAASCPECGKSLADG